MYKWLWEEERRCRDWLMGGDGCWWGDTIEEDELGDDGFEYKIRERKIKIYDF